MQPFEKDDDRPQIEPLADFEAQWTGELILIASRASLAGELAQFDFSWFIPSLVRHRRLLGEVLLVSLALQLFALISPLFFQVVMDKVLVHRGMTTLDVLVMGLVVAVLFESVLSALRSYVFSHTTSRIDVELGARLFRHLLNLPLAYFQARRVGDSVARVRELENIRGFLTGNAITLVIELAFSAIFIAVMFMSSSERATSAARPSFCHAIKSSYGPSWSPSPPDAENPAPVLYVTDEPAGDHHAGATAEVEHTESQDDVVARGLGVAGLVVGAVGLVVAIASRRRSAV